MSTDDRIAKLVDGRWARLGDAAVEFATTTWLRFEQIAPELASQQRAAAQACGLAPERLLALDGGFVDALTNEGTIERSMSLYVDGPRGPVLAGAWALEPLEAAAVAVRRVDGARVLSLPGGLGLAGVSDAGFCIQPNLLRPSQPGRGVPGSVSLRLALGQPNLRAARATIETTELLDGRSWMLADGRDMFGIEQLGDQCVLTRVSPKTGHVHTNHCFDPALRQGEGQPRSSASFRRMELASTVYVQQRPTTAEQVLEFFTTVEVAAFPTRPDQCAGVQWAVELTSGRVFFRRSTEGPTEVIER